MCHNHSLTHCTQQIATPWANVPDEQFFPSSLHYDELKFAQPQIRITIFSRFSCPPDMLHSLPTVPPTNNSLAQNSVVREFYLAKTFQPFSFISRAFLARSAFRNGCFVPMLN
jgi:hypothetical protein